MNDSVCAAHRSASQRATQLARENEILRSHAERHSTIGHSTRSTWFAALVARFTKSSPAASQPTAIVITAP